MSAQADIVINDDAATPVAHTFSKRGATMDLAVWKDLSSGMDIGLPIITQSLRKLGKGDTASNKTDVRIYVPVLETISGSDGGYTPSPKVAYQLAVKLEFWAPVRSSLQNRKDLFAYVKNLLAVTAASNPTYQSVVNFDIPT